MIKKTLVIVGNGMASGRLLDELLARGHGKFQIIVIGDEPQGSYNRIMLSSYLADEVGLDEIIQKDRQWFQAHDMLFHNARVTQINREQKSVVCDDASEFQYDELVLATGSRPAEIPAENCDLKGVYSFRSIDDAEHLIRESQGRGRALVIGGGLLGLEAAYGLARRNQKVTLIHRSPWLLNRQLDETAGKLLQKKMQKLGIDFRLSDEVSRFIGRGQVDMALLKNGELIECNIAVIATGIAPNAELGLQSGLAGRRAIEVDEWMQTSDAAISALGENVEFHGQTFGLVDPIWKQAKTLAARLTESAGEPFSNSAVATKLKVSGVQLFSAGEINDEGLDTCCIHDPKAGIYRKLLMEDGVIKGIILYGDVSSGAYYFELMESGQSVQDKLPDIVFGESFLNQAGISQVDDAA